MKIPCETIVRMARLLPSPNVEIDPIFRTLRFDNGKLIATDRRYMAVEKIEPFDGVFHVVVTPELLTQCEQEAAYASTLELAVVPGYLVTGKTTYGWLSPNIGVFPTTPTDYDKWYSEVVAPCVTPAVEPRGGMIWTVDDLSRLAATSPSGVVVFESIIDCESRPTVVRDLSTYDWCGFFLPRLHDGAYHAAAALPGWLRV
jgi:hypothetical protein